MAWSVSCSVPALSARLYGVVFLGHQFGACLGAWWAGRVFEATGGYDVVWWTAVALSITATSAGAKPIFHFIRSLLSH